MKSSDCGPGYNLDVIQKLSTTMKNDKNNIMSDVALTIDEMAIRKDLVWDPSRDRYIGHIDYGGDVETLAEDTSLASNLLVLMIVGISGDWKCPIGYMFTDRADSLVQKSFVDEGFKVLENFGFNALSLTTDGNTANVSMFQNYGLKETADFRSPVAYDQIITIFPNPANPLKQVCAMYDVVHMLKLWRTMLAQCCEISLPDGNLVEFKYVNYVFDLHSHEGIRAANKLSRYHI